MSSRKCLSPKEEKEKEKTKNEINQNTKLGKINKCINHKRESVSINKTKKKIACENSIIPNAIYNIVP